MPAQLAKKRHARFGQLASGRSRRRDPPGTEVAVGVGVLGGIPRVQRVVPGDFDLDELAGHFVLACSDEYSPERAAAALRKPETPTDELPDG